MPVLKKRLFLLALMVAAPTLPATAQADNPLQLLQGDWVDKYDPDAFGFRVEGDKIRIIRYNPRVPAMKIVDIFVEGLTVTSSRTEGGMKFIEGRGSACYISPDGVKIVVHVADCGFTFTRETNGGFERLQGFGIMNRSRYK